MIKRIETNDGRKLTLLKTTKRFDVYIDLSDPPKWVKRTFWTDENDHRWVIYDGMFRRVTFRSRTEILWSEYGREIA